MSRWQYAYVLRQVGSNPGTTIHLTTEAPERVGTVGGPREAHVAMNRLTDEGWEMCGIEPLDYMTVYWFKRLAI